MKKQYFSVLSINFELVIPEGIVIDHKFQLLMTAYIPGLKFLKSKPGRIDLTVEYRQSRKRKIIDKKKKVIIFESWGSDLPLDFYHLLYSKLRVMFINKQFYPVHSACVGKESYTLIIGHTKSGKTSVLLELLSNDVKVFSGNKTLVSLNRKMMAVAGTPTITAEEKNIDKRANAVDYSDRKAFSLDSKQYHDSPIEIKSIFLVRINGGFEEFKRI